MIGDEPLKLSLGKKKHGLLIGLAAPEQPHRRIAFEQIEAQPRRLAALAGEAAVAVEQQARVALGDRGQLGDILRRWRP